ncbi:MAG: hypothetical protein HQ464_10410, partial [Planctomycetes bacterium]|nr:hypothetical protein [Planctomycetota bacterium]
MAKDSADDDFLDLESLCKANPFMGLPGGLGGRVCRRHDRVCAAAFLGPQCDSQQARADDVAGRTAAADLLYAFCDGARAAGAACGAAGGR